MVHPASLYGFWQRRDAGFSTWTMPATTPPEIRMPMVVPVHRRLLDRFDHLFPGLKTAPFEGEGAQRFPPRLNQVAIGRILRLQDKLPTRVLQTKQPDIGRPMDIPIIPNGVEPLDLCWPPRLDVTKEVHPVMERAPQRVLGQRRPRRWTKRPEDVALTPSSRINLLRGPGGRSWRCRSGFRAAQWLSRRTLGGDRPHLIQATYRTLRRWVGVERVHAPLFFANAGSTRSPNQVSWVRQRRPSAISPSSIRRRLIAI